MKINQTVNEIQEKTLKYETTERVYRVEDLGHSSQSNVSDITFYLSPIVKLKALKRQVE